MAIYYIRAAGQLLEAWSIAELAELVQCAHDAGDDVDLLRARRDGRLRLLTPEEFGELLTRLGRMALGQRAEE